MGVIKDFHNVRYGIKDGFHVEERFAQPAGEITSDLEQRGMLTAKNLVDVSRPEDAELHDYFEWRDDVAAEKYREEQGRYLIRAIVRIEECDDEEEHVEPVKVFYNIEEPDEHYYSIDTIVQSEDKYEKLFRMALSDLKRIEKRYQVIANRFGLQQVFDAIDELESSNNKQK